MQPPPHSYDSLLLPVKDRPESYPVPLGGTGLPYLEQSHASAELICSAPRRPWLVAKCRNADIALVFKPSCKCWNCPACAQINKKRWTARTFAAVQQLIDAGVSLDFVTLTHRGYHTPESARKRWRDCWPKVIQNARRHIANLFYCYVHEVHKSGVMHVHLICTHTDSKRFWKDTPAVRGFGYMNYCEPVRDPARAAFYVSKYLGKQLEWASWPKHWRRIGTCRHWPTLPDPEQSPHWKFSKVDTLYPLTELYERLALDGYATHTVDHSAAWDIVDQISLHIDDKLG